MTRRVASAKTAGGKLAAHSESQEETEKRVYRRQAAAALRRARCSAGLTQEDVAALCGTTRKTIGARERGAVDLGPLEQLQALEAFKRSGGRAA